ncbi:MAG TPA: DUF2344 domain-containing protein, partial [Jiangellaceae bacterium]|nr:DUF2344 domain-containing protein [Jiangellaceae bacterium]
MTQAPHGDVFAGIFSAPSSLVCGAAPTGAASEAEYLEIAVTSRCDPAVMAHALDAALPPGLDILDVVEARKIHQSREDGTLGYTEPDAHCLPQGVPKINMAPVPFKIVQTDKIVVLVYEAFNLWRQVHLDGRDFAQDLNPSWLGFSKGRWEGDVLV